MKVTLRFRGREMAHQELGRDLLQRISGDIEEVGKIESMPTSSNLNHHRFRAPHSQFDGQFAGATEEIDP